MSGSLVLRRRARITEPCFGRNLPRRVATFTVIWLWMDEQVWESRIALVSSSDCRLCVECGGDIASLIAFRPSFSLVRLSLSSFAPRPLSL
jgi:hypothetical protein